MNQKYFSFKDECINYKTIFLTNYFYNNLINNIFSNDNIDWLDKNSKFSVYEILKFYKQDKKIKEMFSIDITKYLLINNNKIGGNDFMLLLNFLKIDFLKYITSTNIRTFFMNIEALNSCVVVKYDFNENFLNGKIKNDINTKLIYFFDEKTKNEVSFYIYVKDIIKNVRNENLSKDYINFFLGNYLLKIKKIIKTTPKEVILDIETLKHNKTEIKIIKKYIENININ